ncbi:MAG: hypothetical protein P9X22_02425 [Candidatus Zapsychrus exili]|nr:hypothetical protein [Candidatus Zapsychrus exili]
MADCNDLFQSYFTAINIDTTKKTNLKTAREAIRGKIRNYFKDELGFNLPKFHGQGSYMMKTIVNPLDDEYDIDDGIYLQHLNDGKADWPNPKEVHQWVYDAVKGHTKEEAVDKPTCIRVIYAGNYHVDLPIYAFCGEVPYLANTGVKGWHESDPKKITDWLIEKVSNKSEQLRTIIKYLKAWADYQSLEHGEMPSGLVITKLVVDNYVERVRDDVSFARTISSINDSIKVNFDILNPVDSEEVISDRMTVSVKESFKKLIQRLSNNGESAINEESKKKACVLWKSEFGDRFYDCDSFKEKVTAMATSSPALLKNDARSAK